MRVFHAPCLFEEKLSGENSYEVENEEQVMEIEKRRRVRLNNKEVYRERKHDRIIVRGRKAGRYTSVERRKEEEGREKEVQVIKKG